MVKSTINGHCQLYVYQRVCLVGWVNPFPLISLPIFPATSAPRMIRSNTQPGLVGKLPNQDRSPRRDVLPAPLSNDLAECLSQMVPALPETEFFGLSFLSPKSNGNQNLLQRCCRISAAQSDQQGIPHGLPLLPSHSSAAVGHIPVDLWTC